MKLHAFFVCTALVVNPVLFAEPQADAPKTREQAEAIVSGLKFQVRCEASKPERSLDGEIAIESLSPG